MARKPPASDIANEIKHEQIGKQVGKNRGRTENNTLPTIPHRRGKCWKYNGAEKYANSILSYPFYPATRRTNIDMIFIILFGPGMPPHVILSCPANTYIHTYIQTYMHTYIYTYLHT